MKKEYMNQANEMLREVWGVSKLNSRMNEKDCKLFIRQIANGLYTDYKKVPDEELKIWAGV
jgi:hypothetical protein